MDNRWLLCGSNDHKVSLWLLPEDIRALATPVKVFHAHHDGVVCVETNPIMGVGVSSDRANAICVYDLFKPKVLTSFKAKFRYSGPQEIVSSINLCSEGLMLLGCPSEYMLYNYKGELLKTYMASFVDFLDPISTLLVKLLNPWTQLCSGGFQENCGG